MLPMATSEYKPNITLQQAILRATGVGHELRKTINQTHKNIERSRRLIKETKIVFEESRSIILATREAAIQHGRQAAKRWVDKATSTRRGDS
jgi:vacuolar-type H+-ATPase subunit E/Vma4